MRLFKSVLGAFFGFIALIGLILVSTAEDKASCAAISAISAFAAILLFRRTKKDKERFDKKLLTTEDFKDVQRSFPHNYGLPVAPGATCTINLTKTGLTIYSSGINFNMAIDKIISISTKTDKEVLNQKQYVSNTGKAMAGAALFGLPGAIIGGRAKEKNISTTVYKNYMVVTYKKDDAVEYLIFDIINTYDAMPFITNFGILTQGRKKETIEL